MIMKLTNRLVKMLINWLVKMLINWLVINSFKDSIEQGDLEEDSILEEHEVQHFSRLTVVVGNRLADRFLCDLIRFSLKILLLKLYLIHEKKIA